jgi:exopolysaccharide biosynthesis protein
MIKKILIASLVVTLPIFITLYSCDKSDNVAVISPKPVEKEPTKPSPTPEPWVGIDAIKALREKTNLIKTITSQSKVILEEGIEHTNLKFVTNTDHNISMHIVVANLNSSKVTAQVLNSYDSDEKRFQALDAMAKDNEEMGTKLMVAVNGDYFSWSNMETTGPFIYDGKIRKANPVNSTRPAFEITRTGVPVFLNAPAGYTPIFAFGDNLLRHVVSGNPWYIFDSKKMSFTDVSVEPRTSIGMLDKNQVVFVAVDGRNATHSSGMSFAQMQSVYEALGAKFAFNLDGGGSTTVVVRDKSVAKWIVVNQPSDSPLRALANGVGFVFKQ